MQGIHSKLGVLAQLFVVLLVVLLISSCGGGGKSGGPGIFNPPPGGNPAPGGGLPEIDTTPPVVAESPGDVGGVVKDAMGVPIPDVEVAIGDDQISAMTDGNGRFLVSEVPAGNHEIRLMKEGRTFYSAQISVSGDNPLNLTLTSSDTRTTSQAGSDAASMHGIVFEDGTDNPVAGAYVIVFDGDGFFRFARSGENGGYELELLPPGNLSVIAYKRGFRVHFGEVSLEAGQNLEHNIPLVRINTGNVEGRVKNPAGHGIARAAVFFLSYSGDGYGPRFQTVTNEEGFYRFEHVPAGEADMFAAHRHYFPANASVNVLSGQTIVQHFVLEPREQENEHAVLEGLVKNQEGQIIVGALVKLFGPGDQVWQTESTENGYRFEVPSGGYLLKAFKQGYQDFQHEIHLNPGANHYNIVMTGGGGGDNFGKVKGRVFKVFPNGEQQPVAGATVVLFGLGEQDGHDFETHTNGEGLYVFENVPAGRYLIKAWFGEFEPQQFEINVYAGQITEKHFYFHMEGEEPQFGAVDGYVYRVDGESEFPVSGATVKLFRASHPDVKRTATTNQNGYYKFEEVAPGENWVVTAFHQSYGEAAEDGVVVVAGETTRVDLVLHGGGGGHGAIKAIVVDQHGEPIHGALVKIRVQNGELVAQGETNSSGYIVVDGLPAPQTYSVKAFKWERNSDEVNAFVEPGGLVVVTLTIERPSAEENGMLFGVVRNAANENLLPGVLVKAYQNETVKGDAMTNEQGYYQMALPAGTYNVRFSKEGFQLRWYEQIVIVSGNETQLNAELHPEGGGDNGVLFGQVVNAEGGAAIAGALVKAFIGETLKGSATTGPEGGYEMTLPAGTYYVRFSKDGFETRWYEGVVVNPGGETRLDAELHPVGGGELARMYGYVKNLEEQALAEAWVKLGHYVEEEFVVDYAAYTNQNGYYVIEGIEPGGYIVKVFKTGYHLLSDDIFFEAGDNREVNFFLQWQGE